MEPVEDDEVVVEEVEEPEPAQSSLKPEPEPSRKTLTRKSQLSSRPKVSMKSVGVECALIMESQTQITVPEEDLSFKGDYMGDLLVKMNDADPRDVQYLRKERNTLDKKE